MLPHVSYISIKPKLDLKSEPVLMHIRKVDGDGSLAWSLTADGYICQTKIWRRGGSSKEFDWEIDWID